MCFVQDVWMPQPGLKITPDMKQVATTSDTTDFHTQKPLLGQQARCSALQAFKLGKRWSLESAILTVIMIASIEVFHA